MTSSSASTTRPTSPSTTSCESPAAIRPTAAPVWIDIGGQDELRPGASRLARELKADGANISFHMWPGAHTGEYWDAHFAQYLRFYADACG